MRRAVHAPDYRVLSLALDYPTGPLDDALASVGDWEPEPFRRFTETTSLTERQRRYVETFDLDRRTSLHLTWYLLGDTRKRGLALLRLKRLYAAGGWPLESDELPDYLPLLLEFATLAPAGYGETLLREHRLALELLRLRLGELESPWACLLDALCASLPRLLGPERDRLVRLRADGPPQEQVGLEPFAPPETMPAGTRP